jgi:pimeloyl-ACP methyl ester carboxylesterase
MAPVVATEAILIHDGRLGAAMKLISLLALCASAYAASVDGIPLHYTAAGKGPNTVILVHGWTCDSTVWSQQVPALARLYRVLAIDLPGHGQSGSPNDGKLTMDLFARAIEAVRAEDHADNLVLVGHSMGTPVVIQYARLYPQHTRALVFVDGAFAMSASRLSRPPDPKQYEGEQGRERRDKMIHGMFSSATTPEMQARILKMMLDTSDATAGSAMLAMYDPAIWKHDTSTIPILGLYAEHSPAYDRSEAARFPHFEYHEIPGTGHFLMMEKPQEFNRLLLGFLANTFAPAASH